MSEFIETLRATKFFKGVTDERLAIVAKDCEQRNFNQGEEVVKKSENPDGIYIIIQGDVEVIKNSRVIATLHKNDFFGEMALFSIAKQRNATVKVASEKLVTLFLPTTIFNYIKLSLATEVFDEIVKRMGASS